MTYPRTTALLIPWLLSCTIGGANAVLPGGDKARDESPSEPDDAASMPGDNADDSADNGEGDMPDDGPFADGDDGHGEPDASTPSDDAGGAPDGDAGVDAGTTVPCDPSGPCPPAGCTVLEYAEHTYFFCSEAKHFDEARATCQAAGADLVIINDEGENAFVQSNIADDTWIGLNDRDTEKTFTWVVPGQPSLSGEPPSYTNWAILEPSNCADPLEAFSGGEDCVVMRSNGQWNDVSCGPAGQCSFGVAERPFVCESY